jgi:hypothetical protein
MASAIVAIVFADRVDQEFVGQQTENGDNHNRDQHSHDGIESEFSGQAEDAISGDHVEGGVGDVDDAGHPEDQRETDGQQGQHASGDETGNENIHNASEEFIDRRIRENRSSYPSP